MERCFRRTVRGLEILFEPRNGKQRLLACRYCEDYYRCAYAKGALTELIPDDSPPEGDEQ
jgi:hypothetical protein